MIRTFDDAVQYGLQYLGSGNAATNEAVVSAKRAAVQSLDTIATEAEWSYYLREARITTEAPYSTGTVQYVASTRALTLAGGTWPTWAASGLILISDQWYEVESRDSDTVLTLRSGAAPTGDISTDTAFIIYQEQYDLPDDFARMMEPVVHRQNYLKILSPHEILVQRSISPSSGTPLFASITGKRTGRQGIVLRIWPMPSGNEVIHYLYRRHPSSPNVYQLSDGSVTTTAGSTTVTGTGTSWTSALVGCVLRIGTDSINKPGSVVDPYPAQHEAYIESVASATSLVLSSAPNFTAERRAYLISSAIDLDERVLGDLYERAICLRLALDRKMDPGLRQLAQADYLSELRDSLARDSRDRSDRAMGMSGWVPRGFRITGDVEAP